MTRNSDADLFREFDHTGDVGIEIEADSRAELFRRAALAMAQLMVDTAAVRGIESRELPVPGTDDADLMHDMLSRLLQTFVVDSFIWSEVTIDDSGPGLEVRLLGELFDPDRHEFRQEIKAVTYHELSVRRAGDRWLARIIFDV
jgi:SHS2 domain-containing protein